MPRCPTTAQQTHRKAEYTTTRAGNISYASKKDKEGKPRPEARPRRRQANQPYFEDAVQPNLHGLKPKLTALGYILISNEAGVYFLRGTGTGTSKKQQPGRTHVRPGCWHLISGPSNV